jgi:hypothetical protein
MTSSLLPFVQNASTFFADTPAVLCAQLGMISFGALLVFLVLLTTRDVLLRIDSFFYQLLCVFLVAALPIVGFLLYLLFRPSRTLAFQHLESKIDRLLAKMSPEEKHESKPKHTTPPLKKKEK